MVGALGPRSYLIRATLANNGNTTSIFSHNVAILVNCHILRFNSSTCTTETQQIQWRQRLNE
eukprot:gene8082-758_t